jgi:hypothetical protein
MAPYPKEMMEEWQKKLDEKKWSRKEVADLWEKLEEKYQYHEICASIWNCNQGKAAGESVDLAALMHVYWQRNAKCHHQG